ncbi:MAG: hypothetical protein L0219_11945, partial [Phycisphaerales bacterium]|nr:hypothetical protein [Phycisphaerales bacterium]
VFNLDDTIDSDVIVGGRTTKIVLNNSMPGTSEHATHQDAGVEEEGSDVAPLRFTGGFRFGEASYSVSENVKEGAVTVSVKRTNGYTQRVVVVRTEPDTATSPANYTNTSAVLFFDIGETEKTVDIPIKDSGALVLCSDPLTFELVLRDATGRPYDRAPVYIGGDKFGDNTDDDTILGNLDWDIILGDSGNIPADAVIQDLVDDPPINNITVAGGPGKDIIRGGDGNDWINGQLFPDIIYGNESDDEILAGLGDDTIYADWANDNIDGDYGDDTIISLRDVPWIELQTDPPLGNTSYLRHRMSELAAPLSTFKLTNIEVAQIFGGPRSATYKFIDWDGAAYISGAQGN